MLSEHALGAALENRKPRGNGGKPAENRQKSVEKAILELLRVREGSQAYYVRPRQPFRKPCEGNERQSGDAANDVTNALAVVPRCPDVPSRSSTRPSSAQLRIATINWPRRTSEKVRKIAVFNARNCDCDCASAGRVVNSPPRQRLAGVACRRPAEGVGTAGAGGTRGGQCSSWRCCRPRAPSPSPLQPAAAAPGSAPW